MNGTTYLRCKIVQEKSWVLPLPVPGLVAPLEQLNIHLPVGYLRRDGPRAWRRLWMSNIGTGPALRREPVRFTTHQGSPYGF